MNVQEEKFYIEPPYDYRPSIVEYLTNMQITKAGFLADILHLDRKGKINIEHYKKDQLIIKLIDDKDLNDNEVYLWKFLKFLEKNGVVVLNKKYIKEKIIERYGWLVRKNFLRKFYENPHQISWNIRKRSYVWSSYENPTKHYLSDIIYKGDIPSKIELNTFGVRMCLLLPFSIFSYLHLTALKVKKTPVEIRAALDKFLLYTKISILALAFLFFLLLSVPILIYFISPAKLSTFDKIEFMTAWVTLILLIIIGGWFKDFFGKYGTKTFDFLHWLFENEKCEKHRQEWLKFKAFVCKYSELENKPLKYYELWGEFYYYALAVGAIKNTEFA